MTNSLESAFNGIAQETIASLEKINCSKEAYEEGIRLVIDELQLALEASKEC